MTKIQSEDLAKIVDGILTTRVGENLSSMIEPQQIIENPPLWETDTDAINPYRPLPENITWAMMGDRKALPKQGIITFSAKQKKGKSLSTYALAIPLLSGKQFSTITPLATPNFVMVFDMEMSENTLTQRVLAQVETIGDNGTHFVVFSLKSKSLSDRIATIREKVTKYNPDIVVIDQAAKLVSNGNDLAESNEITDFLDKMSIDRSVWVVMHENKATDNNNMKGHLGSFLSYAAVEAYGVDKKDGIFYVTLKEARDTDETNAAQVTFAINEDGKIIDAQTTAQAKQEEERQKWRNNLQNIFGSDTELRYGELTDRIKIREGLADRAARDKIAKAISLRVIEKTSTDRNSPYKILKAI